MKILVNYDHTDDFNEIEIEESASVFELKLQLHTLYNIPPDQIDISLCGKRLRNDYALISSLNIKDDVLVLSKKRERQRFPQQRFPQQQQQQQQQHMNISDIFDQTMSTMRSNQSHPQRQQQQQQHPLSLGQQFDLAMKNISSGNIDPYHHNSPNLFNSFIFSKMQKDAYIKQQIKELKDVYLTNPTQLNHLFKTDPKLAEHIVSGDDAQIEIVIRKKVDDYEKKQREQEKEYQALMTSDPNDLEAQKKIAEIIKKKNINENLKYAEEYIPETLVPIHMLYIHLEINKTAVVALVDTGAQSTIMSQNIAEKCGLFNLCDTRYSGIAQGVGTSKIVGVVHAAQIKIEGKFIMCKITVIENPAVGFIFGLDNMRSYRCNIDLQKNILFFPDDGINAKFLSDGEIHKIKELEDDEKDMEIEKVTEESFKTAKK